MFLWFWEKFGSGGSSWKLRSKIQVGPSSSVRRSQVWPPIFYSFFQVAKIWKTLAHGITTVLLGNYCGQYMALNSVQQILGFMFSHR